MKKLLLGALASFVMAAPSAAAIVVTNYEVTASDFTTGFGVPLPFSTATGRYTLSLDTDSETLTVLDYRFDAGPNGFDPGNSSWRISRLSSGAWLVNFYGGAGGEAMSELTNDFQFTAAYLPTGEVPGRSDYLVAMEGYAFIRRAGQVQVTLSTAVPEPAAWAMMIAGFGAVGHAMRRRPRLRPHAV